jgi:hypothetical protein
LRIASTVYYNINVLYVVVIRAHATLLLWEIARRIIKEKSQKYESTRKMASNGFRDEEFVEF